MLDWHLCHICYPLEIKILLLLLAVIINEPRYEKKPVFGSLRAGMTQTGLLSYRDWLES